MKRFALLAAVLPSLAFANVKFSFNNEELSKMIETYSKSTGQKFVVDPSVRGKATITAADNVTEEEAFNLLSSALAINGYAISKQGDAMTVTSARSTQRSLTEVSAQLPALKPERMATWVITLKNISADKVNRELRILVSKDGELSVFADRNQIAISDWTSNLQRVANLLEKMDVPQDPKTAKIVAEAARERDARAKSRTNTEKPLLKTEE